MNVRELREKINLSQQDLADKTGIPKHRIAKWEQGKGNPKAEDFLILENFFKEFVPHETEANDGPASYLKTRRELKNNGKNKGVPFYEAPGTASDVSLTEMSAIHAPSGTIDVGDLLHDSEAAIRIYGNSMLPNYPPGCVVGLAKVTKAYIVPGEVYVVETREQRLLKRLFYKDENPDSDIIQCVSDNTMKFEGGSRDGMLAYPSFNIPKTEIIGLFVVTGVIKRNTNSIIINR